MEGNGYHAIVLMQDGFISILNVTAWIGPKRVKPGEEDTLMQPTEQSQGGIVNLKPIENMRGHENGQVAR